MIEKYTLRSDFADEIITLNTKQDAYEHVEKQNEHIRSNLHSTMFLLIQYFT